MAARRNPGQSGSLLFIVVLGEVQAGRIESLVALYGRLMTQCDVAGRSVSRGPKIVGNCTQVRDRGDRGRGLDGIRDRAMGLGGRATVESIPGEGTTVSVAFPLDGER